MPLIALQVQRWLDAAREKRGRRAAIFNALMATRAARLSPMHVEALNRIDLEYTANASLGFRRGTRQDKAVQDAWRVYLDHLNTSFDDPGLSAWSGKKDELFVELLYALGRSLGYDFDRVHLKRGVYSPIAHSQAEMQDQEMRTNFARLLRGEIIIPISLALPSQDSVAVVEPVVGTPTKHLSNADGPKTNAASTHRLIDTPRAG